MTNLILCKAEEISPGESLRVELEGYPPFAVFNVQSEYFVINDTCSHGEASLCDGEVNDGEVECPWHNAKFCIKSGKALTFPAIEPQKTYKTEILDGMVRIDI